MIVALYALAAAMMIGGIASVIQGFPFVRLESGLAMTIAGATVASAGAILLGLGAVVSRLKRVEGALGFRRLADEARPAPVSDAAEAVPVPSAAEPTPASVASAIGVGAGVAGGELIASRIGREPVFDGSAFGAPTQDDPALPGRDATQDHEDRASEPDPMVPGHGSGGRETQAEAEPELPLATPPAAETATPPFPEPSLVHEPDHAVAPQETAARDTDAEAVAVDDDLFAGPLPVPEAPAAHLGIEAGPAPDEGPALRPALGAEEPAAAPEPSREVVGTYASGSNTYVMFSDGAIQADTPRGRFTFGSLDELKAFVDGGGEADRGAA